jgi:poly(A) polymerase
MRFAAKLAFEIEPATRAPIREMASLLDNVPSSRLFDELFKLLQTGHSLASVAELRKQGLTRQFPLLAPLMVDSVKQKDQRVQFIEAALADTDARVEQDKGVAPSFLLACLLWHEVRERWQAARDAGEHAAPALHQAIDAVFDARVGDISGRGKLGTDMREIWLMQPRFERRTGTTPYAMIEQPRFRAAYDFLRLRADTGEVSDELADWWEDFSLGSAEEREALIAAAREAQRTHPRDSREPHEAREPRPPRQSREPTEQREISDEGIGEDSAALGSAPAKKRRRRRRKPAGAAPAPTVGGTD